MTGYLGRQEMESFLDASRTEPICVDCQCQPSAFILGRVDCGHGPACLGVRLKKAAQEQHPQHVAESHPPRR